MRDEARWRGASSAPSRRATMKHTQQIERGTSVAQNPRSVVHLAFARRAPGCSGPGGRTRYTRPSASMALSTGKICDGLAWLPRTRRASSAVVGSSSWVSKYFLIVT